MEVVIAKAMYDTADGILRPTSELGERQKVCGREACKRERKKKAQESWRENNPEYFKNHYTDYVKPWRQKKRLLSLAEEAGGDKRQDTPLKALPAACFTDTGGQDRDDKRRDTAAEGCWIYLCGLRTMIKDNMDA